MKTSLVLAFCAVLLLASPARAWNCSDPLAARVPVPTGTTGSFGDGDGQLFMGTGTEGVKGQLYECKVPTTNPPTKSKGAPIYQTQTQSQTATSSSNSSSASSSNSNSSSQGGNATGGSVSGSGNSQNTLKNSGNSSNTNTTSATGGAGGAGGQGGDATSSNNSSGNSSTYNSETNVAASRIPVQTAVGLAPPPTVPCAIGFGVGAQTMAFGISGSGAKVDKNCAGLETARSFASMGARQAYCKVMIKQKFAKEAGVTMEDCMTLPVVPQPVQIVPVVAAPVPQPQPQPVIIQVPAPQPAAAVQSTGSLQDLGSFKVTRSYSTNLCPTVQTILGPGGVQILNKAITLSDGGEVILIGNVYTTAVATNYLRKHGVNKVVIRAADEQDSSVAVQIWSVK